MKKLMIGVAVSAVCLSGCASEGARFHPESWYTSGPSVDIGKIAAVNLWAEQKGAKVMWINYPQKPKAGENANASN